MANYVSITSDKSKNTALLCCLFGGLFGVHYFYVGRVGRGLLYACTVGLFTFGWIADIFKIATGNFRDNDGVKLKQ